MTLFCWSGLGRRASPLPPTRCGRSRWPSSSRRWDSVGSSRPMMLRHRQRRLHTTVRYRTVQVRVDTVHYGYRVYGSVAVQYCHNPAHSPGPIPPSLLFYHFFAAKSLRSHPKIYKLVVVVLQEQSSLMGMVVLVVDNYFQMIFQLNHNRQ